MAEQRIVTFRGDVQGVGFRYTTVRTAGGFDVAGTVRNRPDGTVEVVVEGECDEIDAFLDALRARLGSHIRGEHAQKAPASGRYCGFSVTY